MNNTRLVMFILFGCMACNRDMRLRMRAANGNPAAMRELGEKLRGMGNHIDGNEGLRWLQMAAEKGDVQAMYSLGAEYDSPPGSNQKALYWYKKGAEGGNVMCMMKLCNAYRYGRFGLKKDPIESKYWFDKIDAIKRKERGY